MFPPANPSNFSIRIPFLFSIILYIQVERQEAVEEAVEFQDDKTGLEYYY